MTGMLSFTIWALFAALVSQQLLASVASIRFEDAKTYYSPPDPSAGSPPSVSHGTPPSHGGSYTPPSHGGSYTPPSHGGSYTPTPSTPSYTPPSNCGSSPPYDPTPFSSPPSHTPTPSTPSHTPTPSHHTPTPSHGGSYTPTPSHGGSYTPTPSVQTPPCNCGHDPSPPSHPSTPSHPTPSHPSTPSTPTHPTPSNPPSGGYYSSPPPSTPVVVTPPSPIVDPGTPIIGGSPPIDPGTPGTPFLPAPFPPITGTCDYWRNHPTLIWGLLGWWGTVGGAFGTVSTPTSIIPGFDPHMNLLQALSNTRTDSIGDLYREGTASWLNSMVNHNFVFTTPQVRDHFVAGLSSNKAATKQAHTFKLANEGRLKPRI